ncbi:MAG: hypothetical protein AAF611_01640 [Bacteroidota bacterium]
MKKLNINESKLKLHKEKITKLTEKKHVQIKGGATTPCPVGPVPTIITAITRGDCDIHTIGHDDGPNCLSKTDWGWCWCHGI